MDPHRSKAVTLWNESAAAAFVTHAGVNGQRHTITVFGGSSDAAALVTLEFPPGTVRWRKRYAGAFSFSEAFPPGEYTAGEEEAVMLAISAGINREVNLAGYSIGG